MSSAILYVAIVAIWACVLVPRWLRRDAPRAAVSIADVPVPGEAGFSNGADARGLAVDANSAEDEVPAGQPGDADANADNARLAPEPMTAEESRRRMLAARRRLLIMLVVLEAAAVALAVIGLAAMWVVAPPSVMLAGYLLLLREAAHADAEKARRETDARDLARARERKRAQAARRAAAEAAEAMAAEAAATAAALAARLAAAPVAADYEDSGQGRDFAPGLAGKYTPSYADPAADDDYGTYERLRAVGD